MQTAFLTLAQIAFSWAAPARPVGRGEVPFMKDCQSYVKSQLIQVTIFNSDFQSTRVGKTGNGGRNRKDEGRK
jgi:hypothetical protein